MAQQAFYTKINASAGVQFSGGTIAQSTAVLHTNNVLYLRGGSSGLYLQNADGSDGIFVANDHVQITTSAIQRLKVTSGGNVAIGPDTSPNFKLDIGGDVRIQGTNKLRFGGTGSQDMNFGLTIGAGGGPSAKFMIENPQTNTPYLTISHSSSVNGQVRFDSYGSGSFTGTAAYNLQVDSSGNIIEGSLTSGTVTGSGTATYLPIWTGSSALGNSIISSSGGDITINGSDNDPRIYINPLGGDIGDTALIQFNSRGHVGYTGGLIELGDNGQSKDVRLRVNTADLIFQTSNTTRMTVKNDGLVGIGTTSPSANLYVSGSNADATDKSTMMSESVFTIKPVALNSGNLNFAQVDSGNSIGMQYTNGAGTANWDISMQPFGGNVGIGTTSPSEKLEVNGNIKVIESGQTPDVSVFHSDGAYAKLRGQGLFLSRSTSYVAPVVDNFGSLAVGYNGARWGNVEINAATVKFENGANEFMRITSAGNVGIGTSNPQSGFKLDVSGNTITRGSVYVLNDLIHYGTSDLNINASNGSTAIKFEAGASERMRIDSSGNVGINQSNPRAKLEIFNTAVTSDTDYSASETPSGQDSIILYTGGTAENTYGSISWVSGGRRRAMITAVAENSDSDYQGIAFYTQGTDGSGDFYESMRIKHSGQISFYDYRGTNNTGTPTYLLGTDANGLMVKTNSSSHLPGGPYLPLAGGTMSGNIVMGDNDITGIDELIFTSGTKLGDDGADNYLRLTYGDSGAGGIVVFDGDGQRQGWLYADGGAASSFGLLDGTGSWAVRCLEDQYVELRYDNAVKLRTATAGIDVTGNMVASGNVLATNILTVAGAATDSPFLQFTQGGSQKAYIQYVDSGDSFELQTDNQFVVRTGGSTTAFTINSSQNATFAGNVLIPSNLQHVNDDNNEISFTTDAQDFRTNNSSRLDINNAGVRFGGAGARIVTVKDEDDMAANSNVALATQQSIKAYVDNKVTGVLTYQGTWNANTNSPTLSSGSGTPGYYYIVSHDGSTNLDGITDWKVGDWAVFSDQATDAWQKIDNTAVGNVSGSGVSSRVTYWNGTGTITSTAGFTFDGSNLAIPGYLTISGNQIVSPSNLTIDVGGDITLDAGGSDINLKVAGTNFGRFTKSGDNFHITATRQDGDIKFFGNDGGSSITALTLDMSENGNASFSGQIDVNGAVSSFGAGGTGNGDAVVSIDGGSGASGEAYLRLTRGGTSGFILNHAANSLQVRATANIPMYFYTNDIVALTLNTSQNATFAGDLTIPNKVIHTGDTDTWFGFDDGDNTWRVVTGGSERLGITNSRTRISNGDLDVDGNATFAGTVSITPPSSTGWQGLTITGSGTSHTQGAIVIKSSTSDTPEARGQGIFMFNEGDDSTWYTGTQYQDADTWMLGRVAGTSLDTSAATSAQAFLEVNNSGNATFAGDITVGPKNNATVQVSESGGATVKMLAGSVGRVGTYTDDELRIVTDGNDRLTISNTGTATFAGNVVIGTVDSVTTGLSIGEASPTIQLFDTTNDAKLLMYTQDSSSIIGTYSNHPLAFYTDSGLTLTLNTDHSATFAGDVTVGDELTITTILNATADPDKFLCASGGNKVFYRTGAQVLSDIGAAPATGGAYLPLAGGTMTGDIVFNDNVRAEFGNAGDFDIYHDNTDSFIENNTGNLNIVNYDNDKDIVFKSDDGSGGIGTYMIIDGGSENVQFPKSIFLYDNVFLNIGGSFDLRLYHDGNSNIKTQGSGDLIISQTVNDGDIIFKCDDGSGSITEYFKLDGSNVNVSISKQFNWLDSVVASFGNSADLQIFHNSADTWFDNYTGNINFRNRQDDGDIIFYSDNGSGGHVQYLRIDGGITSIVANKDLLMAVDGNGGKIKFGASQDLQMYHDGSNSYIQNATGDLYIQGNGDDVVIQGADDVQIKVQGGEVAANFGGNGGVDLYHNNVRVFSTGATGITVQGNSNDITFVNDSGTDHNYLKVFVPDTTVNALGVSQTNVYIPLALEVDGIVTLNNNIQLQDSDSLQLGNSQDLELYHSSGTSKIDNKTGHLYIRANVGSDTGSNIYIQAKSGENSIICNDDGSVNLYYNNSVKFYTGSSGVGAVGYYGFGSGGTSTGSSYYFRYGSQAAGATQGLIITTSDTGGSYFDGVAQFRNTNTGQGANMFQMINYGALYGRYMNFYRGSTSNIIGYIGYNSSNTAVTYSTSSSDIRLKKNIVSWEDKVLPKFLALSPKKFDFKAAIGDKGADKVKGFIAQYETENFPEVYQLNGEGKDARYGFHPMEMVPYLMKAVKELAEKNEDLERRLAALEK